MPYIEALCDFDDVKEVCVIVPRITYDYRACQGWPDAWTRSEGKLHIFLSPSDEEVRELIEESLAGKEQNEQRVIALFSGISAFPEVKRWFQISLPFKHLLRGIITEAPFAKGKSWLLWLHRLHFLLTDYRFIPKVQYVFAIGDDCVKYYRQWSKHWKVIPFMYCVQDRTLDLKPLPVNREGRLRILFVGALEKRKNVSLLLEALKEANFDYSLAIVGSGDMLPVLQRQAKDWHIKVEFCGTIQNNRIQHVMADHDLLVLPSLHDGWGAVINEAAMVGTLTACSDQCGARSIANYVFGLDGSEPLHEILTSVSGNLAELRLRRSERKEWAQREIVPRVVALKMLQELRKRE